jgi:hypothetical protein
MKYALIALLAVFLSTSAMAEVSTRGLTDAQRAALEAQAAQLRLQNEEAGGMNLNVEPGEIERYANIGEGVARAIGAAARETGMAVNEFMMTPAGKLAVVLIVWKLIGADLVGGLMAIVFLIVATWIYKRFLAYVRHDSEYFNDEGKLTRRDIDKGEGAYIATAVSTIAILAVWGIVISNAFF